MNAKQKFRQAWRELRANGRIEYTVMTSPQMRMAAIDALRQRVGGDTLDGARSRLIQRLKFVRLLN